VAGGFRLGCLLASPGVPGAAGMEIHRPHRRAIGTTMSAIQQRTRRAEVLDLADLGGETTLVGAEGKIS
jgi:hypothetical protein